MADDSRTSPSSVKVKSEDDFTENNAEDSYGSESSDENVPFKKQKLSNGEPELIFKQESCASDNDINGNGGEDADNENESEEPNSSSENSETVGNESSLNRLLRKLLNEKKKELLNHPDIIKLFTPK